MHRPHREELRPRSYTRRYRASFTYSPRRGADAGRPMSQETCPQGLSSESNTTSISGTSQMNVLAKQYHAAKCSSRTVYVWTLLLGKDAASYGTAVEVTLRSRPLQSCGCWYREVVPQVLLATYSQAWWLKGMVVGLAILKDREL